MPTRLKRAVVVLASPERRVMGNDFVEAAAVLSVTSTESSLTW
jgi:hypothetical protein